MYQHVPLIFILSTRGGKFFLGGGIQGESFVLHLGLRDLHTVEKRHHDAPCISVEGDTNRHSVPVTEQIFLTALSDH